MEDFYITGDAHENQYKWIEQIEPVFFLLIKFLYVVILEWKILDRRNVL